MFQRTISRDPARSVSATRATIPSARSPGGRWTRTLALLFLVPGPATLVAADEEARKPAHDERVRALTKSVRSGVRPTKRRTPRVLDGYVKQRATQAERRVVTALRRTRFAFSFGDLALEQVLTAFREAGRFAIVPSRRARQVLKAKPIVVDMESTRRGLTLERWLNLLVTQKGMEELAFQVKDGAVLLLHRSERKSPRVKRAYEVRDLTRPRKDFAGPPLGLPTRKTFR